MYFFHGEEGTGDEVGDGVFANLRDGEGRGGGGGGGGCDQRARKGEDRALASKAQATTSAHSCSPL